MRITRLSAGRLPRKRGPRDPSRGRDAVRAIVDDVRRGGDAAVIKYERRFGSGGAGPLRVSESQVRDAYSGVTEEDVGAIRLARQRLHRAETALLDRLADITVDYGGAVLSKSFVPIGSVGCYVPGGGARYPSSAVMSVTPASVAGVERIVVVSPPDSTGEIDPMTIVAADVCGATEIYRAGGAQAVAALAYGTGSIGRVDKIVGPGGEYVTAAKQLVGDTVAIDMAAGPTELGVIVDSEDDAGLAALDIISQAEHSPDTFCFALATSQAIARRIRSEVESRLGGIGRSATVRSSLERSGFIGVGDVSEIISAANELAPEHLEILGGDGKKWGGIRTPGLVLLGRDTPSAASDYLLGSNHVLPTGGSGRTRGQLSVLDFVKMMTTVRADRGGLEEISGHMRRLTDAEGLPNHLAAVEGRLA